VGTDISIALTMFTVFAPAGAIAFFLLALCILPRDAHLGQTKRLNRWLILPLAVCMTGLVASATHLGTPSNALYVLSGWGRSPLSNEVVSALAFLLAAGLYWLSAFSDRIPVLASKVWLALASLTALWLVAMISIVYAIPTILTWNSPYIPPIMWLTAFVSGPLLAIATIVFAERTDLGPAHEGLGDVKEPGRAGEGAGLAAAGARAAADGGRGGAGGGCTAADGGRAAAGGTREDSLGPLGVMLAISLLSLVAGAVLLALQYKELGSLENALGAALGLAPWYGAVLAAFVALAAAGIAVVATPLFKRRLPRRRTATLGVLCAFLGIAAVRVGFYSLHMTIGL
jgi:DMSO reductase anchor subunit